MLETQGMKIFYEVLSFGSKKKYLFFFFTFLLFCPGYINAASDSPVSKDIIDAHQTNNSNVIYVQEGTVVYISEQDVLYAKLEKLPQKAVSHTKDKNDAPKKHRYKKQDSLATKTKKPKPAEPVEKASAQIIKGLQDSNSCFTNAIYTRLSGIQITNSSPKAMPFCLQTSLDVPPYVLSGTFSFHYLKNFQDFIAEARNFLRPPPHYQI